MRLFAFKILFLLALALLPLSAQAARGYDPDTLVYAWSSNVGPLNPHDYGANKMFAQSLVYEPLVQYGQGGAVMPWLAKSWTVSEDGRVYTFTLRDDVRFSDGSPFNAAAVVKNFDAVLKNKARHDWLTIVALIDAYTATQEHVFQLTLKQPYAAALQELSLVRPLRIMSPAAMPEDGNTSRGITAPVGSGPWKLVESRKGEFDRFERNEQYWGQKPALRQLVVKVVPDAETRAVALETDEVDLIATAIADHGSAGVNPDAFAMMAADPAYGYLMSAPRNTRLLAMNSAVFPTDELAVRQAVTRAVDRPAMVKGILLDQELPAEELLAKDIPFCNVPLSPYALNPQAAADLLDQAGWKLAPGQKFRSKNGKTLSLELKYIANESIMRSIAEVVQADLARIGMEVLLRGEEPSAFSASQVNGNFNMIFCESNGAPYDPFSYVAAMRMAGHADYQAQKGLPDKIALDEAISAALAATSPEELQQLFTTMLTLLHEEAVYLPISRTVDKALYKKDKLTGFAFSPVSYELPFGLARRP